MNNMDTEEKKTMYAIVFDLDTNCLANCFDKKSYNIAYKLIRDHMQENGFIWTQGSLYFGDNTINAVKCVLIVQALSKKYDWFGSCVRDIRMLRIEENNDLTQAIK